ncbi:transglycosylase SLT domain-containing protein [Methylobacterium oxalidis]|uniref:transglycosylase SLT domain-containing protein n=1 Tax=Methylobacterium oxalidis TaxID=944322 RepID=UPI003315DED5
MNQRLLLLAACLAAAPAPALAQQMARDNIDALIEEQARANGLPASFVHQVVKRESNYNPNAKGGSALGLMQIKHATARGLGYKGEASGLYDPKVNLRYGVAYLAGAYRTAKGDLARAYHYYNRGYYYAAKRQGISSEVIDETPSLPAPAASAGAFANLFGLRPSDASAGTGQALAYAAPQAAVAEAIEVPLPPRRPASLGGEIVQVASLDPAAGLAGAAQAPATQAPVGSAAVEVPLPPRRPAALASLAAASLTAPDLAAISVAAQPAAQAAQQTSPAQQAIAAEAIEVPLPPRRPSAQLLAAVARPPARKAPAAEAPVLEASALPAGQ